MRDLFKNLISSKSDSSSKRFLSIYIVMVIGSVITGVALWKGVDYIYLLGTWLAFVAGLLGISSYQSIKDKSNAKEIEKAKIEKDIIANDQDIN